MPLSFRRGSRLRERFRPGRLRQLNYPAHRREIVLEALFEPFLGNRYRQGNLVLRCRDRHCETAQAKSIFLALERIALRADFIQRLVESVRRRKRSGSAGSQGMPAYVTVATIGGGLTATGAGAAGTTGAGAT